MTAVQAAATSELETLSEQECLELLGAHSLGRLALSLDALPVVLPVTYATVGRDTFFRVPRSRRLAAAARDTVVAFEVDDTDARSGDRWTVLATGRTTEVTEPIERRRMRALPPDPWGADDAFLRLRIELVSGCRVAADGDVHCGTFERR